MGTIYRNGHQYVGQNTDSASLIFLDDERSVQEGIDDVEGTLSSHATSITQLNNDIGKKILSIYATSEGNTATFPVPLTNYKAVCASVRNSSMFVGAIMFAPSNATNLQFHKVSYDGNVERDITVSFNSAKTSATVTVSGGNGWYVDFYIIL